MLTLYYAPGSSSFATHIALNEVSAAFDAKPISLAHKEQNQSNYLATTAAGKVPTLMTDGQPLTEVAGILF